MIIDMNNRFKRFTSKFKVNSASDYAKKVGAISFGEHFLQFKPDEMLDAIKTAPGTALLFMIQMNIPDDTEEREPLLRELARRLCTDEEDEEFRSYLEEVLKEK